MRIFAVSELVAAAVAGAALWALDMRGAGITLVAVGIVLAVGNRTVAPPGRAELRGRWLAVAIAVTAAVTAVAAAPDSFTLSKLATVAMTIVTLQGLNVVVGFSGQLVLAHVAFMGVGAYTAAITAGTHGWPLLLGITAAVAVASLAGLLLSIPAARLSGHYLAIASLSLAIIFGPVMKLDAVSGLSGGVQGLSFFDKPFSPPGPLDVLSDAQWHAAIAIAIAAIACGAVAVIAGSPLGHAIRAGRDSPPAAASVGIDVPHLRVLSIVISAGLGGAAGALLFLIGNRFVSPDAFTLGLMIELLVALMVGGRATVAGPVLGALFLVFVYRDGVARVTDDFERGNFVTLAVVFAALAFVVGMRTWAARPTTPRLLLSAGVAAFIGVLTWVTAIAVEDRFVPTALGSLLMGILLIVTVLAVPDGLAALRPGPTPGSDLAPSEPPPGIAVEPVGAARVLSTSSPQHLAVGSMSVRMEEP